MVCAVIETSSLHSGHLQGGGAGGCVTRQMKSSICAAAEARWRRRAVAVRRRPRNRENYVAPEADEKKKTKNTAGLSRGLKKDKYKQIQTHKKLQISINTKRKIRIKNQIRLKTQIDK